MFVFMSVYKYYIAYICFEAGFKNDFTSRDDRFVLIISRQLVNVVFVWVLRLLHSLPKRAWMCFKVVSLIARFLTILEEM